MCCSEVLRVAWLSLMRSVNMTGKNGQQILAAIITKIKTYHKLLSSFATSGKLELSLLLVIQVRVCCCLVFLHGDTAYNTRVACPCNPADDKRMLCHMYYCGCPSCAPHLLKSSCC
jgi:hypothetical protein